MQILTPGYRYELANFASRTRQVLQFIHNERNLEGSFEVVTDGTTNEEVLEVLISRLYFLNAKMPCRENALAITRLEEALMWLEKRTADRKLREVEGTPWL